LRLRGKLDTGARSSALHVSDLQELADVEDPATGQPTTRVRFDVVLGTRSKPRHHPVEATVLRHKMVRDTGARAENRPVVRTRIVCGPIDVVADISLTDRSGMNFRMLLGRLTLERQCLVDPAHGYRVTGSKRASRRRG
jgi:hypothetical protein